LIDLLTFVIPVNLQLAVINAHLSADTAAAVSLFQKHLLEMKHQNPVIHYTQYDYLVTSVLFFSYSMFVWLYISNSKRLNQIVKGLYVGRYANQLAREEVSIGNRAVIFLSALFVLTLTLFFYQIASYFGFLQGDNVVGTFCIIALIIFSIYSVKLLVIRAVGFVFETQKEIREYTISVFLFCNTLGLFLLPVVICLAFLKQVNPSVFIYSGITLIAVFLFTRLIRGLIIGFNSTRVSKFYLFLYLCTLEIVPLVIMVKLFMPKNN
jgi:hypothetical protein